VTADPVVRADAVVAADPFGAARAAAGSSLGLVAHPPAASARIVAAPAASRRA
jgi:hypothetical protein